MANICQLKKADGSNCKRRVGASQGFCWQHSGGMIRKWRSLTSNQSMIFVVSILALVVGLPSAFWSYKGSRERERNIPSTTVAERKTFPSLTHELQPSGSTAFNPERKPEQNRVVATAACREETLKNCSPRQFRDRVLRLTQNIQNLIYDVESRNKNARDVESAHQDDPAFEREQIKREQGIALNFFTETDLNKYRTLYMNSAIIYRTELVSRLGPPVAAIPEHFYKPLDWHELNGVVEELQGMANKLEDGN
jgi:hypothetical protein